MKHIAPRPRLVSAGMGALFALLLHILVWLCFSAAWLIECYAAVVLGPVCILIIGLIALVVIRSLPPERTTFYAVLLLVHILLSALSLAGGELLMEALQRAVGLRFPVNSPDGNLNFLYFLLVWLLLAVGMGILQFLFVAFFAIFGIRDAQRAVTDRVPKEKKGHK